MSVKKKYDLAIKIGSYQDKNGETKKKYKNCGSVMEKDDGSKFILIDPTFNFAGVKRDEGRESVIVSMFEPKDNKSQQTTEEE